MYILHTGQYNSSPPGLTLTLDHLIYALVKKKGDVNTVMSDASCQKGVSAGQLVYRARRESTT
jgi:hypothetical protein